MASEGHSQEQQGILPDGSTSDPGALVLANRVPTHSSASTSFFNASRNLAIGGGTFVSNQTTHNVYFNIPNQNGIPAGTGAANTSGSNQPNDGPLSRVSRWFTGLTRFRVSRSLRRRSPQLTALNGGILTEPRVDQEVYKRHMYPKQLGYPLWIPQSNMSLPRPYRREGVRIGDVGIITPEGGFDYLFNICLPHNHPTNNRAPHDFVPLDGPFDYFEARPYSEGTYLASEQIHASQTHFEYRFRTLAPEGAILTLPRALFLKRLVNVERFNEYIERHAKSWYAYTNNVRGRGVQNGDLRVVFGYHKSSAWGMATFSNGAQNTPQTLRFFSRLPVNEPIPAYMWEGTGVALTKAGPEPADNEGLADDRVQAMNLRNQCLFVGSRSISLSDAAWATIPFKTIVNSEDQKSVKPSLLPQEGHDDDLASIVALNLVPASTQNIVKKKSVIIGLDDLPPDTVDHSKAINMLLLQQMQKLR
ncbi:hypothetical protein BDZ97DRAFT_585154 [Flammula alnicola]|nr:hypothetical protein BDZ97DRAFT_585154 [Flammula alnicola]